MPAETPAWVVDLRVDSEGHSYLVVPVRLAPNQRILDQPPYWWLQTNREILPEGIFAKPTIKVFGFPKDFLADPDTYEDHLFAYFMRGLPLGGGDGAAWIRPILAEPYKPQAMSIMYAAEQYLNRYPYAREYLEKMWLWKRDRFDKLGRQKTQPFPLEPPLSYVGWRAEQEKKTETKWAGLEELLPDASAAEEVVAALPDKSRTNRFYRLLTSGALVIEPS